MSGLKQVAHQHQFAREMHELVQTTQEVVVMKMQQVRQGAEEARQYMDGLLNVFADVRSAERQQIQRLLDHALATRQAPARAEVAHSAVIVFVSTNELFAGELMPRIFARFAAEVEKANADIIIIGKVGRRLFQQKFGDKYPFFYAELSLHQPDPQLLEVLVRTLLRYQRIDIYQGKYLSLVQQQPVMTNISGETTLLHDQLPAHQSTPQFLFEPSLEQIVTFFTTQITATLFRLTLAESHLANLGSRMTTLESSLHNLEKEVSQLECRRQSMIRQRQNRKQQQRLAGSSCWG